MPDPAHRRPSSRVPALLLAAVVALLAACAPEQYPQTTLLPRADFAKASDDIFRTTLLWATIVFVLVETALLVAIWKFRNRPGAAEPVQTHGNTTLEIVWTVVPTILLVVMAVWAYIVLSDNEAAAQDRLVVDVTAQQFAWDFSYPGTNVGSGDLRVPVGRQVELHMRSRDVIHDFYVREFRVKEDVVPGITTRLRFTPTRVGTYQVICAELCGVGHAVMRTRVIVMQPAAYDAWLAQAKTEVASQGNASGGTATAPATTTTTP